MEGLPGEAKRAFVWLGVKSGMVEGSGWAVGRGEDSWVVELGICPGEWREVVFKKCYIQVVF